MQYAGCFVCKTTSNQAKNRNDKNNNNCFWWIGRKNYNRNNERTKKLIFIAKYIGAAHKQCSHTMLTRYQTLRSMSLVVVGFFCAKTVLATSKSKMSQASLLLNNKSSPKIVNGLNNVSLINNFSFFYLSILFKSTWKFKRFCSPFFT